MYIVCSCLWSEGDKDSNQKWRYTEYIFKLLSYLVIIHKRKKKKETGKVIEADLFGVSSLFVEKLD